MASRPKPKIRTIYLLLNMFTGIVETTAKLIAKNKKGTNLEFVFNSPISKELKIDQSVSHNGVCLTVEQVNEDTYTLTAIEETLQKTNLGNLELGQTVNLERCMLANARFDGHIVQGHVDQTAICRKVNNKDGSWEYTFSYDPTKGNITVKKGSICINGVSLTVVESTKDTFSVAIIPYTYENTTFKELKAGSVVNLEFDIIGKYVQRIMENKGTL